MDSAEYFGFPCERVQVMTALEEHARTFNAGTPRRVRLLLDAEGGLHITSATLPARSQDSQVRVRIALELTDSASRWLYHKTTQRALYSQAYARAAEAGFDDVLFLNERGEVTEGAISNVLIEKDGRMYTPPIECGVLPGVFRRHLLQSQQEIEERLLSLDDLRNADAIYICNAVRGLRKALIVW
jgi:para-aminobenzoate synthetase / 4-amino-4-deoxychorismate lyase